MTACARGLITYRCKLLIKDTRDRSPVRVVSTLISLSGGSGLTIPDRRTATLTDVFVVSQSLKLNVRIVTFSLHILSTSVFRNPEE